MRVALMIPCYIDMFYPLLECPKVEVGIQVPEGEDLRNLASQIKQHILSHLAEYLEELEANAVTRQEASKSRRQASASAFI
jgi:hypothetical protein